MMARHQERRLRTIGAQLHGAAAASLDHLPTVDGVRFNYFDLERFRAEHGPKAQPWLDARTLEEREVDQDYTESNKATLLPNYVVGFERSVIDGRDAPARSLTLETQGFELLPPPVARTSMAPKEFYSRARVMETYVAEMEALVCRHLGCSRALCFDANIRNETLGATAVNSNYARHMPHNDHVRNPVLV